MAIKSHDEILEAIRERIGDSTDDESLAFLEDVTDTLNDLESKASDTTDWKTKYEKNDLAWREKYRERFFNNPDPAPPVPYMPEPTEPPKTFEDLFSVKE